MRKYDTHFQACFYYLERTNETCIAPKSCLVYHYLSNICRYSMYPLVQDTFRALFSVGTLCMACSVPWFTKIRPTDSGSDKTMGVHSAQCKDGCGRCWIYTVFSFMNPMQNCVLFLTMKSLSISFHLFIYFFVRANMNTVSWATGNSVNTCR